MLSVTKQLYTAAQQNGDRIPHRMVKNIIKVVKPIFPWISRNIIHYNFTKYKKEKQNEALTATTTATTLTEITAFTECSVDNQSDKSSTN